MVRLGYDGMAVAGPQEPGRPDRWCLATGGWAVGRRVEAAWFPVPVVDLGPMPDFAVPRLVVAVPDRPEAGPAVVVGAERAGAGSALSPEARLAGPVEFGGAVPVANRCYRQTRRFGLQVGRRQQREIRATLARLSLGLVRAVAKGSAAAAEDQLCSSDQ